METSVLLVILLVGVALLCVVLVFVLLKSRNEASTALVEAAALRERSRSLELERDGLAQSAARVEIEVRQLRDTLDLARDECAKLEERSTRIAILENEKAASEASLADLRVSATALKESVARTEAEIAAERQLSASRLSDLTKATDRLRLLESELNQHGATIAELTTTLQHERVLSAEKLELLAKAEVELSNRFKNLANEILEEKSKKFTEQNQSNLSQLLDPLRAKIIEFQTKVEDVYVNESKDRSALGEQVRQLLNLNQVLSQDAKNLTLALKGSTKAQGNWGELVLERILEDAGLRKGHEFDVQQSHQNAEGDRVQPDVVIHLPEDRHLVVDSKVSLIAYEQYVSAEHDDERQAALKRHVESVRTHMHGLSGKNYQALHGLKSLDFVLMFLPIESAYVAAASHDPDMLMEAFKRNVLLVSPFTLLFVVRVVAQLWRQESQNRNAQEIANRGAELYDRLVSFVTDLEKIGHQLRLAQDSFTNARDRLSRNRGNVIRQAEMLKELGVKPTKDLPPNLVELSQVDSAPQIAGDMNGPPQ